MRFRRYHTAVPPLPHLPLALTTHRLAVLLSGSSSDTVAPRSERARLLLEHRERKIALPPRGRRGSKDILLSHRTCPTDTSFARTSTSDAQPLFVQGVGCGISCQTSTLLSRTACTPGSLGQLHRRSRDGRCSLSLCKRDRTCTSVSASRLSSAFLSPVALGDTFLLLCLHMQPKREERRKLGRERTRRESDIDEDEYMASRRTSKLFSALRLFTCRSDRKKTHEKRSEARRNKPGIEKETRGERRKTKMDCTVVSEVSV